jgi:hypothetical protein
MQKPTFAVVGSLALGICGGAFAGPVEAAPIRATNVGMGVARHSSIETAQYIYRKRTTVYRRGYVAPRYVGPGSGSGYGRGYDGPGSGSGYGRVYTGPGSGTGLGR